MTGRRNINFAKIRNAMAGFELSAKVEPNDTIAADSAYFPDGHRALLDFKRPLVVGNRGMGKSFWAHGLLNDQLRGKLAEHYGAPALAKAIVVVGFNGSQKGHPVAPTTDEIVAAVKAGHAPDAIWRAVFLRAALSVTKPQAQTKFREMLETIRVGDDLYSETLTELDNHLTSQGKTLLIVFDALDRLAQDWDGIRSLTKNLLARIVGLKSYRSIRSKIFMRVDQFEDAGLFQFPDSSKIKNDHVDLKWQAHDLYGLLLFELLQPHGGADEQLNALAIKMRTEDALPHDGRLDQAVTADLARLISALAGEYMGSNNKRGRVFTWVPLHLSDAAKTCSPRTFLTAWKAAAEHGQLPSERAVDHLGLIDGVRKASTHRLTELREDYPWVDLALVALRGQFVPILRDDLFKVWKQENVLELIKREAGNEPKKAPIGLLETAEPLTLLSAMKSIAVMEERSNGKINVPDIFRVEAGIKRKGGVAVPRKG